MGERFILLTRGYGFMGGVPPLFCHAKKLVFLHVGNFTGSDISFLV